MEALLSYLAVNQTGVLFGLAAAVSLSLLLALLGTAFAFLSWRENRRLFGSAKKENLKEILKQHLDRMGKMRVELKDLGELVKDMRQKDLRHFQKSGLVRFNPFEDTGSDQSFTLALLDEEDNGVVISSLHGRNRTRIYAKPIKRGRAEGYDFSDEEKEAIEKAVRSSSCVTGS